MGKAASAANKIRDKSFFQTYFGGEVLDIGAGSDPSRVFKGMRMAGRMGGKRAKVQNLVVLKVDAEKNLLVVKGSVPGAKNSTVIIEK